VVRILNSTTSPMPKASRIASFSTLILLLASSLSASASEIDDVSTFYTKTEDATPVLDRRVQEAFDKVANSYQGECNVKSFAKLVAEELVSFRYYSGAFEMYAARTGKIQRLSPSNAESIYRDTSFSSSIIGRTYGLDPTINLGEVRIGTDKLGHFMDHGYKLYELHQAGRSVSEILKYAIEEEEGAFGLLTTGIKSYGDIASAYDGFRFWKNVSAEGKMPYFKCEGGRITKVRDFSFKEYVNLAWSEAINCNDYHSWSFANDVKRNAEAFEKKDGRRYTCPIVPAACPALYQHYEKWLPSADASLLISPHCPRGPSRPNAVVPSP
jgi:hypothetical protein